MVGMVDTHLIKFVEEWGDVLIPQLGKTEHADVSEAFAGTKCKIIRKALKNGERVYALPFKDARGMVKKWLYDSKGRMLKDRWAGLVAITPSVVTLATVDIEVPFISSDEVLLVRHHRDKPYNLEKELVEKAMRLCGCDPAKDLVFMFCLKPDEAGPVIRRFVDELKHIMTLEYLRKKGVLAVQNPKWKRYHTSEEIAELTDSFFFGGVRLEYHKRKVL